MKALTKKLANALRMIAAVDTTWTITMVEDYYADALKLAKLGLVEFKPLFKQRGKYRGAPNGYYVIATPAGKQKLKEILQ